MLALSKKDGGKFTRAKRLRVHQLHEQELISIDDAKSSRDLFFVGATSDRDTFSSIFQKSAV